MDTDNLATIGILALIVFAVCVCLLAAIFWPSRKVDDDRRTGRGGFWDHP